jgi:hypothetical protein
LNEQYGHQEWPKARELHLIIVALWVESTEVARSPRYYYVATDFAGKSFWQSLRTAPERRDGALMQFLGVPWFLFHKLVQAMSARLPAKYNTQMGPVRSRGRPSAFDAMDMTALALRRYQTQGGQEALQIDFGAAKTVISRYLCYALHHFDCMVKTFPRAEIRYPTLTEATMMWYGVVAQFGEPPAALAHFVALTVDGTATPVKKSADAVKQKMYYSGNKGDCTNNILVKDFWGLACDYVLGAPGSCHDMGISSGIFNRHSSEEHNPHGLAMLADSGFKGACQNAVEGGAPVYRPLTKENVETEHLAQFEAWSAWVTRVRQVDEWGQAAIKHSFPYFASPVRVQDLEEHIGHQLAILHLHNLRTRAVGFNQLTTTLKRHMDSNYAEQLQLGQGGEQGLRRYMAIAEARYNKGAQTYGC